MTKKTLVWFRQDLRLHDNPALFHAASNGSILPVYIFDETQDDFKMGAVSRWWLHNSLKKLNEHLNNNLGIYSGKSIDIITRLINEHKPDAVYWNRCYESWHIKNDSEIKAKIKEMNIECESFKGSLLYEPLEVLKDDDTYYKVFTPFYKKLTNHDKPIGNPYPKPAEIKTIKCSSASIDELHLIPKIHWYSGIEKRWKPGEENAHKKLDYFLRENLQNYKENRNFPSKNGISEISPYLHFGEISPRQIYFEVEKLTKQSDDFQNKPNSKNHVSSTDAYKFLTEIGWREFSYYLLYHFEGFSHKNFQAKFDSFPWNNNAAFLKAWQKGQTGYPIVDAGMRELWQTGFMHNRIRMVVSSFLVKNLLIHWHKGAEWFWDCLVDADLANNSMNWQWITGSGADAAPYFRIFNPVLQGEKFDSQGSYTRQYVPELKDLPLKYLFKPWQAPEEVLKLAGIKLGDNYPKPIVDMTLSRNNALEAYRKTRT